MSIIAGKSRLAWINGPRGPQAQIWTEGAQYRNQKPIVPLQSNVLTADDAHLSFQEIVNKYPYVRPNPPPEAPPTPPEAAAAAVPVPEAPLADAKAKAS